MWLGDYLQASMFLCILAALHFAVVQLCLLVEGGRKSKIAGLIKAKPIMERLYKQSRREGVTLKTLLSRYSAVPVGDGDRPRAGGETVVQVESVGAPSRAGKGNKLMKSAPAAVAQDIKEADLTFILYAAKIFSMFDKDESGLLSVAEVRKALRLFNVYMCGYDAAAVMCMFLRDEGNSTPVNEMDVSMRFSDFTFMLMRMPDYALARRSFRNPFMRLNAKWHELSPSVAADVIARWMFPELVAGMMFVFELASRLHWY
mmetsp:Transcript_26610/g.76892  ORF Transcript_26610/g.76892 Transcript_26610/m.76892 type:complete len:259 (+) Transcript_26610:47-823(+)